MQLQHKDTAASSLDTKFWPMVPSPAGYQQGKGSRLHTGAIQADQKAGGCAWSQPQVEAWAGLLAHCVLSSAVLSYSVQLLVFKVKFHNFETQAEVMSR